MIRSTHNRNALPSWVGILVCSWTLWLGGAAVVWPQPPSSEDLAGRGTKALAEEKFEEASRIFDQGYSQATDDVWKNRFGFYRALCYQQQAQTLEPQEDLRVRLLSQSAELYEQYIGNYPQSGQTYNNLARVRQQLGISWDARGEPGKARREYNAADRSFQRAIELDESRTAFYLLNYAEFLDLQRRWEEATRIYTRLVVEQPACEASHRAMMRRTLAGVPGDLAGYLWDILDAGQASRASGGALEALLDDRYRGTLRESAREELLTLVAAGLGRETYLCTAFDKTEAALGLRRLAADSTLGEGAKQIIALHHDTEFDPRRYAWWATRGEIDRDPPRGLWPRDGFRALIRSLGERYREQGDADRAKRYLRLAIDLYEREVDPVAFRQLARVSAQSNDISTVTSLAEEYERRLFTGKGSAYRNSQAAKIFQFHQALGEMYSLLGKWGSEKQVTSAIFQLENAKKKSRELEGNTEGAIAEEYRFTPEMTELLARGYSATNRIDRSYEVRLEEAERYQAKGDYAARDQVLEGIRDREPPAEVKPETRQLYLKVMGQRDVGHRGDEADPTHIHQLEGGQIHFYPTDSPEWNKLPDGQKEYLYHLLEKVFSEEQQRRALAAAAGNTALKSWNPRKASGQLLKDLEVLMNTEKEGSPVSPRDLQVDKNGMGTLTVDVEGKTVKLQYQLDAEALKKKSARRERVKPIQ